MEQREAPAHVTYCSPPPPPDLPPSPGGNSSVEQVNC
jgi:hypothetical protein